MARDADDGRYDDDEDEEGLPTEEDLERLAADFEASEDPEERWDLALSIGDMLLGADAAVALEWYERALEEIPEELEALGAKAEALFELWRFDECERACEEALGLDRTAARASFVLGMLRERQGDLEAAERHYRMAVKGDPKVFALPVRLSREAFESVVKEALGMVPAPVERLLEEVTVVVDDVPPDEAASDLARDGLAPTLLGLFEGTPPMERPHDATPALPPRITLYQRNLERVARNRDELRDEIARTVLHEVGHLVGMDEDDLDEAGYQ